METKVGKFSFVVPELTEEQKKQGITRDDAGKKIEKSFEYQECSDDAEAQTVLADKKLSLKDIVNDKLKANARSNAYQAALLPYRPSEVDPEDIKERTVRDFIRLGIPENVARAQVESLLASQSGTSQQ